MYDTFTGRFRFRRGLFGRRIMEVEIDSVVDDINSPYGLGTESFHIQTWRKAGRSTRSYIGHLCQNELSDTFKRIGVN